MPAEIGEHGSGVRIADLLDSQEFLHRALRPADPARRADALKRLEQCMGGADQAILDELVQIAIDYCHADSSGISLEEPCPGGELQFRWIAVAGSFRRYLNGITPRFYSPCGTCLDRGTAQHYQVFDRYFNFLGLDAEPILDGLLIPWRNQQSQGTIWLISHSSENAFDLNDYEFLQAAARFVAQKTGSVQPHDPLPKPVQAVLRQDETVELGRGKRARAS